MRQIFIYQIIVLSSLLFSCSGSEESSSNDEEKRTDFITNENEFIDHSAPDSLLSTYMSMRKDIVFNSYGDSETEGFSISGKLFYEKDGYYIVNIEENWDQYSYPIALVINPNETSNFIDADGMYTEISDFIDNYLNCEYAVYTGSFIEAPAYKLGDNTPFILENISGYRAEMSSMNQLYLYDGINKISATNIIANSLSDGDCNYPAVHQEKFVLGANKSRIEIERRETHRDGCEDLFTVKYSKIWTYDECDLSNSHPQYFKGDYVSDVDFGNVPTELYQLHIDGTDTFQLLDHSMKIMEYREESGPAPMFYTVEDRTSWDSAESLIVGFKQLDEGQFKIIERATGDFVNGKIVALDGSNLSLKEMDHELFTKLGNKVANSDHLYQMQNDVNNNIYLYSSDKDRYPELDIIEEI